MSYMLCPRYSKAQCISLKARLRPSCTAQAVRNGSTPLLPASPTNLSRPVDQCIIASVTPGSRQCIATCSSLYGPPSQSDARQLRLPLTSWQAMAEIRARGTAAGLLLKPAAFLSPYRRHCDDSPAQQHSRTLLRAAALVHQ